MLEAQLRQTRQDMQEIIQNLQETNEEIKISNEESLSMNEELQSPNEELASSKEEMQSLNEELTTVNAQLEQKVVELEAANNDLDNLLQNTKIACLFLDRELRIRRYTNLIVAIFSILPSDIGRPIFDFASPFSDDNLIDVARRVLANLNSVETELRARDGKWYWRCVQPYQTADGHVEGIVITFADITGVKRAEEGVRRLATVVHDSNDAITVHDFKGRILEWNRAAERMYGYSNAEAQGLSALAAVEMAGTFVPDVVLLDLGLPGMNGYETAQQLRAMPEMRDALLIAVSGYALEEDRQRSAHEGFDGHLKKPVEVQEILAVIRSK